MSTSIGAVPSNKTALKAFTMYPHFLCTTVTEMWIFFWNPHSCADFFQWILVASDVKNVDKSRG